MLASCTPSVLAGLPALDASGFLDGRRRAGSPPARKEVAVAKRYIQAMMEPTRGVRTSRNSYGLKHDAERWAGEYVSNGAFIQAALELGVTVRPDRSGINGLLALRVKHLHRSRRA